MKLQRGFLPTLIITLMTVFVLSGCGKNAVLINNDEPSSKENTIQTEQESKNKILVYTTIFPLYDFARQIGGEYVTVENIVPAGVEPHDFEPTVKNMIDLNKANLFIYNGAGYERWIEKSKQNINNEKVIVVNSSEGLELLEVDHQEEPEDHGNGKEDHDELGQYDPHVWLDPLNAKKQATHILKALIQADPEHEIAYQDNYNRLMLELDELDLSYKEAIQKAAKKEVIVTHKAFSYLEHRYGFVQIAIAGLSPSDEPTQKELITIIDLIKERNLKYVAYDSIIESKVAQTVQRETGAEAVTLFTVENATNEQLESGITYIDLMKENLNTIKKVLEIK